MSIDYGRYAGWTAKDLLRGKGSAESPFPNGHPPDGWDWQNFLNYGGDSQAQEHLANPPKEPAEPKIGKAHPKAKPKKAKPVVGKSKPLKRKVAPKKKAKKA